MRSKRFVAVFDTHGDLIDRKAEKAFFEFLADFKPEIRVHGGDAFDFRWARRKATETEQRERIGADLAEGLDFLKRYKPTKFLRGNHDERVWDFVNESDDDKLVMLCGNIIEKVQAAIGRNCEMFPYERRKGVLRLGHLKIIHGYHAGITAARQAAQIYGSVLQGHAHTVDVAAVGSLERRVGRVCGCLCNLDMPYMRANAASLRHAHGWAYGLLHDDGTYTISQCEGVNGKFVYASGFKELVP